MTYQHIEIDLKDGLGAIILNRPPVNILNIAMMEEINDVLKSWQGTKDCKVVLFKAKGRCFSAGADVGEHIGDLAPKLIEVFHGMFRHMDRLGIPIAAQIMPRIMGRKAAMDLILSGRIISAEEALTMGLVNKVVKEEELESATNEFLKPYLQLSAEVLRQTKKAIMTGLRDDLEPSLQVIEDIYLNELMKTADANEGLQAFVEKRKPKWKNE